MRDYRLIIKNEKVNLYDRFALFLFILNTIGVIYFIYRDYDRIIQGGNVLLTIILCLLVLAGFFFLRFRQHKNTAMILSALGLCVFWIYIGYWWVGLITLGLFYLYIISKRKLTISLNADRITYPSFPVRDIKWNELNNVILRDGLLTIDFKNNKLIQQNIQESVSSVNEEDFNEFCHQQLQFAAEKD